MAREEDYQWRIIYPWVSQKFTKWRCPIPHLVPSWRTKRWYKIRFQMQEPKEDEWETAWPRPWCRHLEGNQTAHRLWEARALQHNLRKQASFTSDRRLIRRPPFAFGRQTWCQKFILTWSSEPDQRKFLISFSILKQMLLGKGRNKAK